MIYPEVTPEIFRSEIPYRSSYEGSTPRWLFVCSAGLLRSPTCARIAQQLYDVNARSCGVHNWALIPLTLDLITWAERVVFVDETCYLAAKTSYTRAGVWDEFQDRCEYWQIPDRFHYMDPELVAVITKNLRP